MRIAPSVAIMTRMWRFVFRLWRPQIIYVNHSYGFVAVSVIIAAKRLGIATVEQQHGIIGNNHMPYLVPATLETEVQFPLCDYMITWGRQAKRLFIQRQIYDSESVFVCGFPRLDRIGRKPPDRSATLASLNLPHRAKLILYTASPLLDSHMREILRGLTHGAADGDVHYVIKLHPSQQTRELWKATIKDLGLQRVQVVKDEVDFYAVLTACDLHISFLSTTFIEAALLGRPNLGLDLPYYPDPSCMLEAGAYKPVALETLASTAQQVLDDEPFRNMLIAQQTDFARDWCLFEGDSVERIVRVRHGLIEETRG